MTAQAPGVGVEFGLDTFGDVTLDPDGSPLSYGQVIRNVVAEAVLADRLGIDFIGLGEHHRKDFAISAPEIILAAIAGQTERIHLGTSVTVLSSDDPIRVFERFATLDALSDGRGEIIIGRGSFTESFALFGYDLGEYERLFDEKLDLLAQVLKEGPITWSGTTRTPLTNQEAYPKTDSGRIRAWIGVGGTPQSVLRAAHYDFPLVVAIIGGEPARFAPLIDLYRRALTQLDREQLPVAAHSPGFVADSDAEAADLLWPHHRVMMDRIGRERGWPPITRDRFEAEIAEGALHVGSPETVARKIANTMQTLGLARFDLKYSVGTMPHERMMHGIELYGTQVIPRVRELLKGSS